VGIGLAVALLAGCSAHRAAKEPGPSVAAPGPPLQIPIADELAHHFEVMDQAGSDAELGQSLEVLRARPQVVAEVERLYDELTRADLASEPDMALLGYARWKAVNLLGSLGDPAAVEPLTRIARTPLPDPLRVSELRFAAEYRIRLRAIAGLETLRAVDRLESFLGEAGLLRGAVAASLYELGRAPEGVAEVDKTRELTITPPRYRRPQKLPEGAERIPGADQQRPDTAPETAPAQAIVPEDREGDQR
jgi:hypothetical protein